MEGYNIYLLFMRKEESLIRKVFKGLQIKPMTDELQVYQDTDFIDITSAKQIWINISAFDDVVKYGINSKNIYTSMYYKVKNEIFSTIMLTFTIDDSLIIGYSIPCNFFVSDAYKSCAKELMRNADADAVSVFVETPPPLSTLDFWRQTKKNALFSVNAKVKNLGDSGSQP